MNDKEIREAFEEKEAIGYSTGETRFLAPYSDAPEYFRERAIGFQSGYTIAMEKAEKQIESLESRLTEAEDFIEGVKDWENAYPEDVFPPVGEDTIKMMCKSAGISMDRLSAAILRKCIIGWCNSAEAFLNKENK